jgi:hypothetical protein
MMEDEKIDITAQGWKDFEDFEIKLSHYFINNHVDLDDFKYLEDSAMTFKVTLYGFINSLKDGE